MFFDITVVMYVIGRNVPAKSRISHLPSSTDRLLPIPDNITLPMLRLLSFREHGNSFRKPFKPWYVSIHRIALTDYSQVSTHVPKFRSFFSFFCIISCWPN